MIIFNDYSISIYENKQSLINNYLSKVVGDRKVKELNAKTSKQIMHDLQLLPGVPLRNQISNDFHWIKPPLGGFIFLTTKNEYYLHCVIIYVIL